MLRFVLLPVAAVALVTALLLLMTQVLLVRHLERLATQGVAHDAHEVAQRLDSALRGMQREVRLMARSRDLLPGNPAAVLRAALEELTTNDPRFIWVGLAAPDGRVLAATRGWLEGRSLSARPVFLQGRQGSFVGEPHPAVLLEPLMSQVGVPAQELLDFAEPVLDANGQLVAVLAAHAGTAWLDQVRELHLQDHQAVETETVRLHVLAGPAMRSVRPGESMPAGLPAQTLEPGRLKDGDGQVWLGASTALGSGAQPALLPWRVYALQLRHAALRPAWQLMATLGLLGVLSAVGVAMAGAWLARRQLQPGSALMQAVLQRTRGETDLHTLADAVTGTLGREPGAAAAAPDSVEALLGRLAAGTRDLRRIVDHLPVGVAVIDPDFRVAYVNRTYSQLLGWTTPQVRGRVAAEFLFDAGERAGFVRLFSQFGDTPGEVAARFDALRPDGTRVPVQWHLVPIVDEGRLLGAIAVITDIRPERHARARADAMAGRLQALSDAAVDQAIVTLDGQGRVLEWSRGAMQLTGHAEAAARGRTLDELLPPCVPGEDAAGCSLQTAMVQARRDGLCRIDGQRRAADGRSCWFEGALYPLGLAPGSARFGLLLRDTTAARSVSDALADSEARLRLALQAAAMGSWDVDLVRAPRRVRWSEGYDRTFGVRPEELPPDDDAMYALVHPDDRAALREGLVAAVRDGQPLSAEFRIQPPSGERWHAIHGQALRGPDGRAQRLIGVGMDVTARKAAEQALRESRAQLARIVDTMAEGMVVLDAEGRYVLANPAAARLVGVDSPAQILGRRFDDVPWQRTHVAGRRFDARDHAFMRLRGGEPQVQSERVTLRRADGGRSVVSLNARPVRGEDGAFEGVVMTFVDVTARVDGEARLAGIVDGASDAIVSTDVQGRVQLFNPAAERTFGVAAAAMLGQPLDRLLPTAMHGQHAALMGRFARSGVSQRRMGVGRVAGRHADGRELALDASISQSEVDGEQVLTAILRDVTERAAHERMLVTTRAELAALTARLLEQEKQTTRRLAQVLHDELGQTLAALRLHWEALPAADKAAAPAMALHQRIDALLTTANRQIRGVLGDLRPPMLDEFGLVSALDNEIAQQRPSLGAPALTLVVPPRLQHQRWPADVEYAAFMVAREALGNALYHARAQEVQVSIEGDEGELRLCVDDDGVGIGEGDLAGRPGHLGLVGMRERALAIGARLLVTRIDDGGTQVCLQWTLQ